MNSRQTSPVLLISAIVLALAGCDDFKRQDSHAPATATPVTSAQPQTATPDIVPPSPALATPVAPPVLATAPVPVLGAVASASPEAQAIEASAYAAALAPDAKRRLLIKVQVLLDRANFSPGVIDGRDGSNMRNALAAFEQAHGLAADGAVNAAAETALTEADPGPVTQDYVLTADDVKGPFLGTVPTTMEALSKLTHIGYATAAEGLAEKFHMDEALLRALNPGADFTVAGTSVVVVRPNAGALAAQVARIEVDKTSNQVRAFDAGGKIVAVFPATVGSTERPAPSGDWAVRTVAPNPTYGYDPTRLTFGDTKGGKLTIAAGPNNPVGAAWIDLTKDTFGIHGSPDPTKIGKAASHGCVRLTNWDVIALSRAVKHGTVVSFVGAETRKS